MSAKKIFIIACEPSADLHGAHLINELRKIEPLVQLRGLGGPQMQGAGVSLLFDMTKISALGLGDVLRQYFTYRKIFYTALADVETFKPDVIIVIDSPAFNLRFAKKIKKRFPVIYYIAPQIWAWGGQRIYTIKRTISKMLTILPFEKELYEKAGVPCEFVGHPLLDSTEPSNTHEALRKQFEIKPEDLAIGLMPGSREKEVRRILPPMLESALLIKKNLPESIFFLTQSPNISPSVYSEILEQYPNVTVRKFSGPAAQEDHTRKLYDLVTALDFALIASGTATLEAALLGTPFFLLYKTNWTTYFLGKNLIRVPYLGLANLLAGKKLVPEFIQDIQPEAIAQEAKSLLKSKALYQGMKKEFLELRKILGQKGASERAAQAVMDFLS